MKNNDIDLMIKVENTLGECFCELVNNNEEAIICDLTYDEFISYWNLVDRLIKEREANAERTRKRLKEKRKENPYYGRSRAEIETREKAKAKRLLEGVQQ